MHKENMDYDIKCAVELEEALKAAIEYSDAGQHEKCSRILKSSMLKLVALTGYLMGEDDTMHYMKECLHGALHHYRDMKSKY